MRILFSNLAYGCGIPERGFVSPMHMTRYVWCSLEDRRKNMQYFQRITEHHQPDVVGIAEITCPLLYTGKSEYEAGLFASRYPHHALHNKYGQPHSKGRCNAWLSAVPLAGEAIYFSKGYKRLAYRLRHDGLTIFFVHLALGKNVRLQQLAEIAYWSTQEQQPVLVMGDCNVFGGFSETVYLQQQAGLQLLNEPDKPTYTYGVRRSCLDLALIDNRLAARTRLTIIPQPFSDHDAIMVDIAF